jgi:thioesterase domain-containing protein/acyl carrier protein
MRDYFIQSIKKIQSKDKVALQVNRKTVSYQDLLDLYTIFRHFCEIEGIESDTYIGCQFKHSIFHLPIAFTLLSNVCYVSLSQDNKSNYLDYFISDDKHHPWIEHYKAEGIGIILFHPIKKSFEIIHPAIHKDLPRNKNWVSCSQSSGTTSKAKIIVYSSQSYVKKMTRKSDLYGLNEDTKLLNCVPFDKITTLGEFIRIILKGGTLYANDGFSITFLSELFKDESITHFAGSVAQLIQINHELNRFEQRENPLTFIVGGSDFDRRDFSDLVTRLNCKLVNHYGSKEVGTIASDQGEGLKPVVEINIINHEIWVRTESLMDQYLNGIDVEMVDDWFNTKDTGYLDDRGFLHLTGRISEWINLNGEKFSPIQMENTIKQLFNCRVVVMDLMIEESQEIVCVIEKDTNIKLKQIRKGLINKFEAYHLPKKIYRVDSFNMSEEGKLDRRTLKANYKSFKAIEDEVIEIKTSDEIVLKLIELIHIVLPNVQISLEDSFIELGGDSLKGAELNALIIDEFNLSLEPKYFLSLLNINDMVEEIKRSRQEMCCVKLNMIESDKPPLFFIHDLGLDVIVYHNIANLIQDRAVYGLKLTVDLFNMQDFSIEDLAKRYLEEIKKYTQGPLYLAGLSIGGLIAYEMAVQEKQVDYCLMIDTRRVNKTINRGLIDYFKLGIKNGLYSLKGLSLKDKIRKILNKIGPYSKHMIQHTKQSVFISKLESKRFKVIQQFKSAVKKHECKAYDKRIDYFLALDENDNASYDYYHQFIPNLKRFEAHCLHSSFVKGSQINQSVCWINQSLNEIEK